MASARVGSPVRRRLRKVNLSASCMNEDLETDLKVPQVRWIATTQTAAGDGSGARTSVGGGSDMISARLQICLVFLFSFSAY